SRGGSPTARGKRVPGVEINVQIVQAIKIDKLDFHRVCLQSEKPLFGVFINSMLQPLKIDIQRIYNCLNANSL
ncbi:hypothetical protein Q8G35_27175, partial [Peribacillus simplex]